MKSELIRNRIQDSIAIKKIVLNDNMLIEKVLEFSGRLTEALESNHKLILCGNGGSASDALHFAGEIVGRFQEHRNAWPAVCLNSDVATMTAVSNDYGFDEVFARQAKAHTNKGDVFIGISTSGRSENVYRAAKVAKERGAITAALLGCAGGKIKDIVDYPIIIPCDITARVQECHIMIIHIICEIVENTLSELNDKE